MAVGEEEDLNDIDDEEQREEKQLEWGKGGFKGQTEEKGKVFQRRKDRMMAQKLK